MQQEYSFPDNSAAPPSSGSRFVQLAPRFQKSSLVGLRSRGVWASVPALLLLGLAGGAAQMSPPQPLGARLETGPQTQASVAVSDWENGVIAWRDTALVEATTGTGVSWSGVLQPVGGISAKAPVGGQVSRVWAKVGDTVNVGDPLLELSSGAASREPLPMEREQAVAEQAQVRAAQEQAKLQASMMNAQSRLHEAQLRVAAAQRRLAAAREVLEQAKSGGSSATSAASTKTQTSPATSANTVASAAVKAARAEREKAAREVKDAEQAARVAAKRVATATRAVENAERAESAASQKLVNARRHYAEVQELFNSGTAKGSEIEIARAAVEDAQAEVQTIKSRAEELRSELAAARAAAAPVQQDAEDAQKRLSQAVQHVKKVEGETPASSREAAPRKEAPQRAGASSSPAAEQSSQKTAPSVTEAARIVRAAIKESRAAVTHAEKIKKEVQSYESRVKAVNASLDSSTRQLEAAQQRVIENTILAKLSVVRAPASGKILSMAAVAAEIAPGDSVATVGQSNQLKVYFKDTSGYWKQLRKDARLTLRVQPPTVTSLPAEPLSAEREGALTAAARIEAIQAPQSEGQPALVTVMVHNPARAVGQDGIYQPGWVATLQTPDSGSPTVFVPQEAVFQQSDLMMAAVLQPQSTLADDYLIDWRIVKLGARNGNSYEVLDGLNSGERVVLQPAKLHEYSMRQGEKATIRLLTS